MKNNWFVENISSQIWSWKWTFHSSQTYSSSSGGKNVIYKGVHQENVRLIKLTVRKKEKKNPDDKKSYGATTTMFHVVGTRSIVTPPSA